MRVVVQRISHGEVKVDGVITGKAKQGLLLLAGFSDDDEKADLEYLSGKILNLRIFEDIEGKMNLSVLDIQGEILSISQFTLYGDVRKGRRPSFTKAAKPEYAENLYDMFNEILRKSGLNVETGVFGGDMKVSFTNDGPVTILMDSKKIFKEA